MKKGKKKYVFVVQVTRQLSVDILNAFVRSGAEIVLLTGSVEYNYEAPNKDIKIRYFNKYKNASFTSRIVSGIYFTIATFFYLLFRSRRNELILVSTPPFSFYTAWFLKKIRGQKYHLVVWDLYPDVLVNLKILSKNNVLIKCWSKLNKWAFHNASSIFTLGMGMDKAIRNYTTVDPVIIPNWVESSFIVPLRKEENSFVKDHHLQDKLVVLYSGNLGLTHDVEAIVSAAKELAFDTSIKFVIIGDGPKLPMIKEFVNANQLTNVLILPYQDKSVLPYSLTSADICIVTLSKGAESVSVPSKTYYSMAAGASIFAIASNDSELGAIIKNHNCGYVFEEYTPVDLSNAIVKLKENKELLDTFKFNARKASLNYTPQNAYKYYEIISNSTR
ncbi:MAG: glycosyltransferase family 4 protein [Bacteroidetes bacterium]|nr:glycosyltransferase family 4 protein [Bacteroidota bacterium]